MPPDRLLIWVLGLGTLMAIFSLLDCTRSRIFLLSSMMGPLRRSSREAMEILSATLSTPMMPVARRSSVSRARLLAMASRGCLMCTSWPLIQTLPAVWARRPKMPSISSVRCAPTRPATPRISPLCSSKLQWRKLRGWMEVKSSTLRTTSLEGWFSSGGYWLESSRPTILAMISSLVMVDTSHLPMYWPSRMMVTSSAITLISSILWLMYTSATPWLLSSRMMRNRDSTSLEVKEEVGSSRIRTLQLAETALAISTICICAMLRLPSLARGLMSSLSFFSSSSVSLYILGWSTVTMGPKRLVG